MATGEIDLGGRRLRAPLAILAALLLVGGGLGFMGYRTWFAEAGGEGRRLETAEVTRTTIRATIASSGTVASETKTDLNFGSVGKVKKVYVKLGDQVQEGQVLAVLEDDELANALATAQAAYDAAVIKLRQLEQGATDAEIAAADQAVATAQASLDKATKDLNDLRRGATSVELTAAEQALATAQSTRAKAQAELNDLLAGPSDAELAAAEANLETAQTNQKTAERAVDTARSAVDSGRTSMESAYNAYCDDDGVLADICAGRPIPLSDAQVQALSDSVTSSTPVQLAVDAARLVSANQTYNAAVSGQQNAEDALTSAREAVRVAQLRLDELRAGPSESTITTALAALDAAQAGVEAAQAKLDDLRAGPSADTLMAAESAVASAQSSLLAAQARREELLRGAKPEEIDLQQTQVTQAALAVEKARLALDKTRLRAPFAGTIGAVNLQEGEYVTAAPQQPAITLLSPESVRLDLTIGEADLPSVHPGSVGAIIFDAIQGQMYPFRVTAIGLAPKTQQGVVTYVTQAALLVPPNAPRPAAGMTGAAVVVQEQRDNVLTVPARAIRKRGTDQIVEVVVDGVPEERVIKAGLSDGTNTEVIEGLAEHDVVVLPAVSSSRSSGSSANKTPTIPGGIR